MFVIFDSSLTRLYVSTIIYHDVVNFITNDLMKTIVHGGDEKFYLWCGSCKGASTERLIVVADLDAADLMAIKLRFS